MKKNESKYFYTAELMNQALVELLEKKEIEFITVTEIAKKAGVNRSTFIYITRMSMICQKKRSKILTKNF